MKELIALINAVSGLMFALAVWLAVAGFTLR